MRRLALASLVACGASVHSPGLVMSLPRPPEHALPAAPLAPVAVEAPEIALNDFAWPRPHAWLVDARRHAFTRRALDAAPVITRDPPGAAHELAVIGTEDGAVRLRMESSSVRVLAWVPRSSLRLTVVHTTTLAKTLNERSRFANAKQGGSRRIYFGGAGDEHPPGTNRRSRIVLVDLGGPRDASRSVTLLPGAEVQLGAARNGARAVHGAFDGVTFDGWVDDADVGDLFVPADGPAQRTVDARLRAGTEVLATPTGPTIARLSAPTGVGDRNIRVERLAGAPLGYVAIKWSDWTRVVVEGLVAERDVTVDQPAVIGHGLGMDGDGSGTITDSTTATVPRGTYLYDVEGRERVGLTLEDVIGYNIGTPQNDVCSVEIYFPILGFEFASARCADLKSM